VTAFWLVVAAAAIGAVGVAGSGTELVLLRLLWGAAEGMAMPPLYRLLIRLGKRTELGSAKVVGWFGGAAVAGMAAGPVIVGFIHAWLGFRAVFFIGAAFTLAGTVFVMVTGRAAARAGDDTNAGPAPARAARLPGRLAAGLIVLFGLSDLANNAVYSALEPILPLHIQHFTTGAVGVTSILFTLGLVLFAVVSPISGYLVERAPLLVTGAVAFAVAALALAGQTAASSVWTLGGAFVLFMATQPVLYTVDRRGIGIIPEHSLGRMFGLFGLLSDLGFILGPLLGTFLFAHVNRNAFAVLGGVTAILATVLYAARAFPAKAERAVGNRVGHEISTTDSR
jgi:MFS family permease